MSVTISDLIDLCGVEKCSRSIVPVPNVHSSVLERVLHWCHHHRFDKDLTAEEEDKLDRIVSTEMNRSINWDDLHLKNRKVPQWDCALLGADMDKICELLHAAEYMHIPGLLRVGCKMVATLMKGKGPLLARTLYKIQSDLDIRKEQSISDDLSRQNRK